MDGQRQYPGEAERWYEDELGPVPTQRDGDRLPPQYSEQTYGYAESGYPDQGYPEQGYTEQNYADSGYRDAAYDDPPVYSGGIDPSRRRGPVRTRRSGQRPGGDRSGPLDAPADADVSGPIGLPGHTDTQGPRGLEQPAPRDPEPAEEPQRYRAERIDRSALRRPAEATPAPDFMPAEPPPAYVPLQAPTQSLPAPASPPPAVYLSKRPGIAALIWIVTIVAELFLARVLLKAEFGDHMIANDVLASMLAMIGAPLTAVGLYGLVVGAATAGGPNTGRAWLRTPLAYLPVGLILIFAAALAA